MYINMFKAEELVPVFFFLNNVILYTCGSQREQPFLYPQNQVLYCSHFSQVYVRGRRIFAIITL